MLAAAFRAVPIGIRLAFLLCAASPAPALQVEQSPFGPLEVEPGPMPDPTQGIIRLDIVVTDDAGNPVSGLSAKDFTLLDNGRPQPIVSFHDFDGIASKPDPPVQVILVIDELDLPAIQVSAAEHEVKNFLSENQGRLLQPVSIYRINEWGLSESVRPPTDGQALIDGIAHKEQARTIWASSMFSVRGWDRSDAVSPDRKNAGDPSSNPVFLDPAWNEMPHALVALGTIAIEERRRPGRKIMFWLGPGWEINQGRGKGYFDFVTDLSTRLREARIDLWSATEWPRYDAHGAPTVAGAMYQDFLTPVKSEMGVTFGNLALQVVGTQTGGGVIQARNDLGAIIAKRVSEANKFYSLTFDPQRTNVVDEYRTLQVEVDKPGLTAHTSSGYYDEPVFYDQPGVGERVTAEQLEQILTHVGVKSDAEAARQLDGLELTERLSSTALATWKSRLKGKRAREALTAVADESVFLAPPVAEIPVTPPPDTDTQRRMILRTVDYVNKTIPRLPDFFATRETTQYQESERKLGETWKNAHTDQSLHPRETSKATVRFRNGQEVSEGKGAWGKSLLSGERMLDVVGTFGPILTTVLSAATGAKSNLAWSRWEEDAGSKRAVFGRVPLSSPAADG
jgi:VWFA-related protein